MPQAESLRLRLTYNTRAIFSCGTLRRTAYRFPKPTHGKAKSSYTNLVNKIYNEANKQELLSTLGKHTLSVASGAASRQEAVRNCIKEFSQKGIPAFVDKAGREWSPEAYINMDIRTTVNNTANAVQDACCDKYGIDLFQVTSYMGARPKCAKDQGKLVSRSNQSGIAHDGDGNPIPFIPLSETSYGEPDGLFGINCHHKKYPFIDGVNFQRYFPYDEEENAERYKEFQHQRYLERRVRETSRQVDMLNEIGDTEGAKEARRKLTQQRKAYRDYSDSHGLAHHNDRLTVTRVRKGDNVFPEIHSKPLDNGGGSGIMDTTTNAVGQTVIITDKNKLKGPPNGITQTTNSKGGIDRNYYDSNGDQTKQITNHDHSHKAESKLGKHGEHAHDYAFNDEGKNVHGKPRELSDEERKENADIL